MWNSLEGQALRDRILGLQLTGLRLGSCQAEMHAKDLKTGNVAATSADPAHPDPDHDADQKGHEDLLDKAFCGQSHFSFRGSNLAPSVTFRPQLWVGHQSFAALRARPLTQKVILYVH